MTDRPCRVLMIYPRFASDSFWVYTAACEIVGARYPTIPLGLITVAAMLPKAWDVRLVNRNTEDLADDDLDWADMVMTGGMLFQQTDTLKLMEICRQMGKPVVLGGPDVTSFPHVYQAADFQVLGEVEGVIDDFVAAWDRGERKGVFEAPKFQADVTKTPIPRFDLLKFDQYLYMGVQFSRGCPFTCEFCDIIELYGRVPRTKNTPQMLAELDRLYELGYRGHVDFVDDNLIGNKKSVKAFLPHLRKWQEDHGHPFEFSTEASLNLSDDDDLLALMRDANFFAVFVGIESPDTETLKHMKKKQNTRRNIAECIQHIYSFGMFVTAGFIIGFDSEKGSVAEPMIELIEDCSIPISMVGLLYALGTTQLGRRLAKEGRLYAGHDTYDDDEGDHCTAGLNFETLRPRYEILEDYRQVLQKVFEPAVFAGRLQRLSDMLDRSKCMKNAPVGDKRVRLGAFESVHRILAKVPEAREPFWQVFTHCARTNPSALRFILGMMAIYAHLGPFSRKVVDNIERQMTGLHNQMPLPPRPMMDPAHLPAAASGL